MTGARKVRPQPQASQHAKTLLAIRHQQHWSQLDLANALGVSRETISRWERGTKDPHPAWMRLVALLAFESNGTSVALPPNGRAE